MPPGIQQYLRPGRGQRPARTTRRSSSARHASASATRSTGSTKRGTSLYAAPFASGAVPVDWATATRVDIATSDLEGAGRPGATYAECRRRRLQARNYAKWNKDFARWLAQSREARALRHRDLKLTSNPGESERDFQIRVHDAQRVARDAAVDALQEEVLRPSRRRSKNSCVAPRPPSSARQRRRRRQKLQTGLSVGATILGAYLRTEGDRRRFARTRDDGRARRRQEHEGDRRHQAGRREPGGASTERARALQDEIIAETRRITEQFDAARRRDALTRAQARAGHGAARGLGWCRTATNAPAADISGRPVGNSTRPTDTASASGMPRSRSLAPVGT